MIAEREIEINNILPEKKDSEEISSFKNNELSEKIINEKETNKSSTNSKKLTNDFFKNLSTNKSVSFSEIEDTQNNFSNELDNKYSSKGYEDNIQNLLYKILENQNKILNKLEINE